MGVVVRVSRRQSVVAFVLVTALCATIAPAQAEPTSSPSASATPLPTATPSPTQGPKQTEPKATAPKATGDQARPAAPTAATATGPANYAYDAAGRLVGVSHPQGEAARYRYDAAGNLLDVTRQPSSQLSVLSAVPASARPGATVTLSGTGFAAAPAGNAVSFHGTAATVTAATATTLKVTVPAGATTGPITVTTGGSSATTPFTVAAAGPTVSAASPTSGPPSTEVTITGTGFDTVLANNVVTFNGVPAELVAVTPTQLRVRVPVTGSSGPLRVETPNGTGRLAGDFLVPPVGVDPALIESVTRIEAGAAPTTIRVSTPGKVALVLMDAPAGPRFSVGIDEVTVSTRWVDAKLFDPLGMPVLDNYGSSAFDLDVQKAKSGATYQLVLDPNDQATAEVKVSVSAPVTGELTPTGDGRAIRLTSPGQDGRLSFEATAGEAIGLAFTGNTIDRYSEIDVFAPSGKPVDDWTLGSATDASQRLVDLPETGRYEVVLDPSATATGEVTVTYSKRVRSGEVTPAGAGVVAEVTRPGQDALLTFDGTAGDVTSFGITENTFPASTYASVLAPDGTVIERDYYVSSESTGNIDLEPLPATGTYRLIVAPTSGRVGKLTVTYSRQLEGGRLDPVGAGTPVDIGRPGQDQALTFDGTAGEVTSLGVTENTFPTSLYVRVIAPNGTVFTTNQYVSPEDEGNIDLAPLPATGTYRVIVAPNNVGRGTAKVSWSRRLEAGRLDPVGAGSVVEIKRPAQDATLTFDGTAGEVTSIGVTSNSFTTSVYVRVLAPDGSVFTSNQYVGTGDAASIDLAPLPVTGTYRVIVAPNGADRGTATFTLSRQLDGGVLSRTGAGVNVNLARPGQDGVVRFDAAIGDSVDLGITANTIRESTYVTVFAPDGTKVVDRKSISSQSPDSISMLNLTKAGTYRVLANPIYGGVGALTLTLSTPVDLGELVVGAAGRPIAIARAGQDGRLRFTGTAAQKLRLSYSGDTYPYGIYFTVLNPAGTTLVNRRFLRNSGTYDLPNLPAAGTYNVVVDPDDAGTGQIVLGLAVRATAAAAPQAAPALKSSLPDVLRKRAAALAPPPAKEQQGAGPETWTPDKASLHGTDWNARRARPTVPKPLTAARGVTALAGHTLTLDGKPLRGVGVSIGGTSARTDAAGRFLLPKLRKGTATLIVDGTKASSPGRRFGVFHIKVDLVAGRTTVLPYTIWLQRLDTAQTVKFASPSTGETVLTNPKIPGLEVRIPAGSVVRDSAGKVVTELGITPIPIDRPPFPLPKNRVVPVYFTVQPGGTYVFPDGARIIYPNYTRLPAGQQVDFWNYDPEGKGWYVYGHGKVSADAKQVVPDAKTKVWAFHGAMFNTSDLLPFDLSSLSDLIDWLSGDPVELSTGLMVDRRTDLALDDTMPISLTRTLWQGDTRNREFGIGQLGEYGLFLNSREQYQEVDLYLPGGAKVHYVRTSAGTSYSDAVFDARGTAGHFRESRIAWNGGGWDLTLRDGTVYVFPMYAPLAAIRDRHGNQITLTRADGTKGPLTRITSPNGRWIAITNDAENRMKEARDNIGRTVKYSYNGAGRLETVIDPAGKTIRYEYDADGRVRTITDAKGIAYLTNTYGAGGRVTKQVLAGGTEYGFDYTVTDGKIRETRVTEPGGAVRRVVFDANGAVTSDTKGHGSPLARTTTYQRGPDNRVDASVDPAGRRTEVHYDAAGRTTSATVLAGTAGATDTGTVTYGGPFHQPLRFTDRLGKVTSYVYEPDGDLASVTDPAGRTTRFTYDDAGQTKTLTDSTNRTTTLGYRDGDLVSTTDPLGRVARRFVDAAGRVVASSDPLGATTQVAYDALNQVTKATDPLGNTLGFEYDDNGNLKKLTDALDHHTVWEYDGADRIKTVTDPLGNAATMEYDAAGRPDKATSRAGNVTTFDFDLLGRNTSVSYQEPGAAASTVTFGYDPTGRLDKITDTATPGEVRFGYDSLDRLTSLTQPQGTVGYRFDAVGRRSAMTVPGQPDVTYGYDDAGELSSLTQGGQSVGVDNEPAGRRSTITLPGGWSQHHEFDDAGQLTAITYQHNGVEKGGLGYTRDAVGRITGVTGNSARVALPPAQTGLSYDAANRLKTVDGATLNYDRDGNLTGDGTSDYDWNARGQLAGVTKPGTVAKFGYDPLGQRTNKTLNGTSTDILNDADHPVKDGAASTLSGGLDQWFSRTDAGGLRTFLTDATGSTVALGDASGQLRTEYGYDPYGAATKTGEASGNPFTYTGREDDGTGLMYYRARYYSPTLQRFISEDPIGFAGGSNLYAYAANDPANHTDPSGNNPILAGCLIGGLTDGAMDWLGQRLSGRKVDWGLGGVGGAALAGCAAGALGAWAGKLGGGLAKGCGNSFTPDTRVRMADGTHRRIADVRAGDRVLATDPETGRTVSRRVVALITGDGTKRLVDLTVDTDGSAGDRTGSVVATMGHPFWVKGRGWVDAGELRVGDRLRTPGGALLRVLGARAYTEISRVHNLTVDGVHTFYVAAGERDVLVHNSEFCTVPYRPTTPGLKNHHGVPDVWTKHNVPGYPSRSPGNPTITLTDGNHNAAHEVMRDWSAQKTGRPVGGQTDWTSVGPREIRDLAERMFDAASVPRAARDEYYSALTRYLYGL